MISHTFISSTRTESLALLLKVLREQVGMTQEELAERSGLSIRAISDLERGRTVAPHRRSIELLAEALGIEGSSLEHFRQAARNRTVAECPACSTTWHLDDLIMHARSA
ncbi:helix-turn-helix domain-containing protein [Streptacidiphilus sp. EB103A]|uniref:helix-turn-helix domain-containing protein n=1 Tax=Streptacidiphilus sp. EB103A TaxID=3156275 RepID=UPI003511093E